MKKIMALGLFVVIALVAIGCSQGDQPETISVQEAFAPLGDNFQRIWVFSNTTGEWRFFDPRPDFADANTLPYLRKGQPVDILVEHDQTLKLFETEIKLYSGLNTIVPGGRVEPSQRIEVQEAFQDLDRGMRVWHFANDTKHNIFYNTGEMPIVDGLQYMTPGEVYWILAREPMFVTFEHGGQSWYVDCWDRDAIVRVGCGIRIVW